MTQLSEHFTVEEMTLSQTAARNGIDNVPAKGSETMKNLTRLAKTMEEVRTILGDKPILISSGYRSPRVNMAVGGSKSSAHMSGLACDFTCASFGTPLEVCNAIKPHLVALEVDQLIWEFATWCHLAIGGKVRHQCLTIDNKGARAGF